MKPRTAGMTLVALSLAAILTWFVVAEAPGVGMHASADPHAASSPGAPTLLPTPGQNENDCANCQTILLWPKRLEQFVDEYPSWREWLGGRPPTPSAPRDELLVSVRAIAAMVPDLEIIRHASCSDVIAVSGNPASIGALLERLRGHPLLERITMDSTAACGDGTATRATSDGDMHLRASPGDLAFVNIRNSWVTNIVWGQATPNTTAHVTLRRSASHAITTTASADTEGLYHAYLEWEIRDGDVVVVDDGVSLQAVHVVPLRASSKATRSAVTGFVVRGVEMPDRASEASTPGALDVILGRARQRVQLRSGGSFTAEFIEQSIEPGTRGFLLYASSGGSCVHKPLSTPIVNVRRDTSYGLPYGSAHSAGLSSIVWGSATPDATLVVTLTRPATFVVTRSMTADQLGDFSVSVDRLIEDGDTVQVFDGTELRTVYVPTMSYNADAVSKTITGTAPAGITSTDPSAPHSLEVTIAGDTRQITTGSTGDFLADFSDRPYLAGLLGTLRYTTPDGDRVYKPLFVADPLVRGKLGDWWADTILGQPDFSEVKFNEVAGNKLFNPGGVYVDRSADPNRVYVYDAGNSRVLGLSHLGLCTGGANSGHHCTTDSDCPGAECQIQEERAADIVLGQSSFNTSACNGDTGYQLYPDVPMASAETLCGLPEHANSVSESGSCVTMASDGEGNVYVPDFFNNRVLRYDNPFLNDATADSVWGQTDFSGIFCNRGASYGHADAKSLCLAPPGGGALKTGVAIDSTGNLWVADTQNNRVLRFPMNPESGKPAQEADLVLGQPGFSTTSSGDDLSSMDKPASVRVDDEGVVFVADGVLGAGTEGRVLVFEPPLLNGMSASTTLGENLGEPTGLETDPVDGVWVNDCDSRRILHFVDGYLQETLDSVPHRIWGGLGVDDDRNVIVTGWDPQEALCFSAPSYVQDKEFLQSKPHGMFNHVGPQGFYMSNGVEIAAGQLIYADGKRLLFWNNPWSLVNYQPADGVIGQADFYTQPRWGKEFSRMRADDRGLLWVLNGALWQDNVVYGYDLPLATGATPRYTIASPLPLRGGGVLTWTNSLYLGGIEVQPGCDCIWLSDEDNHRVFRVNDVTTQPVVDIVLGQLDASGTDCNQGRGRNYPSRDSLCNPGALAFDGAGNLYVADHNLEFDGNLRLLTFDSASIPDSPTSTEFGIPASHVFGRDGDFTNPHCLPLDQNPMCGPWEPTFDSKGRMVVGFNGYLGPRFPMVYQDPLTNPYPVAALGDFHSMPLSGRFDKFDNLYIIDHNRNRILIYRQREVDTYKVTGTIETPMGDPVPGVYVQAVGYAASGVSDASGAYTLTGLITGTYEIVPSMAGYAFAPSSRIVHLPPSPGGQDFTAAFQAMTHNLEIHIVGEGDVEVEPEQDVYHYGDIVTLTATAHLGWTFAGWSGDIESTDNPLLLTIDADKTLTATFELRTYVITPTVGAGGVITPGEPQTVNHGDDITFTIAANTGYHIADVLVDGISQGAISSYTFSNVTVDHTISAAFALGVPPEITSADHTTFVVGQQESFTVAATGAPTPTIALSGTLPGGVTFTDNGDGTATLSGTPAVGSAGEYALTLTASNGVTPDATQAFGLTVNTKVYLPLVLATH